MSALKVHSHHPEKIVFKRERFGCANRIPLFAGIAFLLLPAAMVINRFFTILFFDGKLYFEVNDVYQVLQRLKETDMSIMAIFFSFLVFGILFIVVGGFILPSLYRGIPRFIVFDHKRGGVIVQMKDRAVEGFIPYRDIIAFNVHRKYTPPRSSDASNRGSYCYYVYIKKRDGGEWFLTETHDPMRAKKDVELLRKEVPLDRSSAFRPKPYLSPKISLKEGSDTTMVAWGNPFSAYFVFLFLFTLMFATASVLAFMEAPAFSIPFLIFSTLLVYLNYRMVRLHTRKLVVTIDTEKLLYYEFSKITGKRSKTMKLALADIDRIVYTFSPMVKGATGIRVMTKEDTAKAEAKSDLKSLLDFFSDKNQVLTLTVTMLNPVECLHLEEWLQEKIREKNREVRAI